MASYRVSTRPSAACLALASDRTGIAQGLCSNKGHGHEMIMPGDSRSQPHGDQPCRADTSGAVTSQAAPQRKPERNTPCHK